MSAKQLMLPAHRAFNSDGAPEVGATASLYLSEGLTPAAFYSDSGLTNSIGSTITANSAGRFDPMPYGDSTVGYRLIIKDAEGSTIDDIDPFFFGLAAGVDGANASIAVGTTTTGAAGGSAVVANSGTGTNAILNFTIPTGAQGPAGDVAKAADRTALAAIVGATAGTIRYLYESGREGHFIFDSSNLSAKVTIDTSQGIYVAPASDTTGASGAWVRKFSGYVMLDWFGVTRGSSAGANGPANDVAIAAMWAILSARSPGGGGIQVLEPVDFGPGTIEITSTITPPASVIMTGRGMNMSTGNPNDGGTQISNYGCTAFLFGANCYRSQLRDMVIRGDFSTTEAEYHGVQFRQTIFATNVRVTSQRGDGWFAEGITASGYLPDCSRLMGCEAFSSRNGFYFDGNDANVIQVIGGLANGNRRWGVWDSSFLGNSYFGVETAGNGVTSSNDGVSIGASVVSYSGNRYACIAGQEAGASTNAPSGTTADNAYWMYLNAGGVTSGRPAWTSGMVVRAGGSNYDDNLNSCGVYSGCYAETDQGKAQIQQRSLVSGGLLSQWMFHNTAANKSGGLISTDDGVVIANPSIRSVSGSVTINVGANQGNAGNYILRAGHANFGASNAAWNFANSQADIQYAYNGISTTQWLLATGPNTANQFGTGAAFPYALYVPNLMVADNGKTIANARRIMVDNAVPATQAHGSGEFIFNRTATLGANFGWRCYAAGTPGSWEALYSGYGTANIGYATGAGGAVTQATSKSTGVTLNKLSGQVTMNAAALAAGAKVSFVVTNSTIAATDVIIVSVSSGGTANAYRASVTAVAAGSFTITVENITAGSLSESPVINFAVMKAVNA